MSNSDENKTSDEILSDLFKLLNESKATLAEKDFIISDLRRSNKENNSEVKLCEELSYKCEDLCQDTETSLKKRKSKHKHKKKKKYKYKDKHGDFSECSSSPSCETDSEIGSANRMQEELSDTRVSNSRKDEDTKDSKTTSESKSLEIYQHLSHKDSPKCENYKEPSRDINRPLESEKNGGSFHLSIDTIPLPYQECDVSLSNHATNGGVAQQKKDDAEKVKGKSIIVIKSLKNSIVFQQAQEEALKRENEKSTEDKDMEDAPDQSVSQVFTQHSAEGEDGEIVSDGDSSVKASEVENKKTKSNKSKRRKRSRSRSRSREESRKKYSRSRSRSRSRDRRSRRHHKSSSRHHYRTSRSRSRSRSRSCSLSRDYRYGRRRRRYSKSRSPSRSRSRARSRSRKSDDSLAFLRDKMTRKHLLEIARANATYLVTHGCLPPSVEADEFGHMKSGKSIAELTSFCRQLVSSSANEEESSESTNNPDGTFSSARHPFAVKDSKPIIMNIRNSPMIPVKSNAERLADQAKLRELFPVSSGSQHRTKEWVPVEPKEKVKKEDKVFPEAQVPLNISEIVSSRLSAMRKLQDNPNNVEALKTLQSAQSDMQTWALSKQQPGQFTGSTGARVMSQQELSSGFQAWARKEQFKEAAPVSSHFGMRMLQKMGWSPGEGLGKNKEGALEPLVLDVKVDKKGFHAQEEVKVAPRRPAVQVMKDVTSPLGKHPVSALVELCIKKKSQLQLLMLYLTVDQITKRISL